MDDSRVHAAISAAVAAHAAPGVQRLLDFNHVRPLENIVLSLRPTSNHATTLDLTDAQLACIMQKLICTPLHLLSNYCASALNSS